MPLERELATFKQKLPEFKDQEGRFVLIHFVSRFLQLATIGPDLSSRQPTVLG